MHNFILGEANDEDVQRNTKTSVTGEPVCKIYYFDGTVVEYGNEYNNWISAKYVADNYFDNLDEDDKLYFCQYLPNFFRRWFQ